jgi:vanillate O-demethylase monooxygenase subunit
MFLRNYWYVAADDHEIGAQPFARTILNEPIVFFRKEDGTPVALEDRCCHRHVPLSKGTRVGDNLRCWYHGLTFDGTGKCVRVPGQQTIPENARVRAYPVVERHKWVWIWMGDPALADPAKIPDYRWRDHSDWGCKGTYYYVKCNYQLIVDNLLDLTHLAFVHESTIGNAAVVESADVQAKGGIDDVTVVRWMLDKPAPPTYVKMMEGYTGNIDRWQIIHWAPPGNIRLFTGGVPSAASQGTTREKFDALMTDTPAGGIGMRNLDVMTPETESTTHYFWAQAHDFEPHNPAITDAFFKQIDIAFHQDWELFEVQQASISRRPGAPSINIAVDKGPMMARRLVTKLLEREKSAAPVVESEAAVLAK